MATQAALIADTIVGLKKALQRENDCMICPFASIFFFFFFSNHWLIDFFFSSCAVTGPDEPITQPTNRGNKLRANAQYVREGALGYARPQEQYKEVRSVWDIRRSLLGREGCSSMPAENQSCWIYTLHPPAQTTAIRLRGRRD